MLTESVTHRLFFVDRQDLLFCRGSLLKVSFESENKLSFRHSLLDFRDTPSLPFVLLRPLLPTHKHFTPFSKYYKISLLYVYSLRFAPKQQQMEQQQAQH